MTEADQMKAGTKIIACVLILLLAAMTVYTVVYGGQKRDTDKADTPEVTDPGSRDLAADIILSGSTAEIKGTGASVSGSTVSVVKAGKYRITGTLDDGQIRVSTSDDKPVILVLNGVTVTNSKDAALFVENSHGLTVYLSEGTVNVFQSGQEVDISYAAADSSASGGALTFCDDAAISGEGRLEVYGYINNGIHCSNDLLIDSGNIEVRAVNNGIKGKDSLTVTGGTVSVVSAGDGLKSDDEDAEDTGTVTVSGGNITVSSLDEGIKATTLIKLIGGELKLDSKDDGINCDKDLLIDGATVILNCADDGLHADGDITIESGNITVNSSTEGIEGRNITVNGGNISLKSSDDGFNCTTGEGSAFGWRPGNAYSTGDQPMLIFNGGTVYVDAQGDGLDSNGSIIVNGGLIIVDGPTGNGNGSLDSGTETGGTITVNGGTLLAVGSTGMAETPDRSSGQYSFYYGAGFTSGTVIKILDSNNDVLLEHTAAKSGGSIIYSSPELELNGEYTLLVGNEAYDIIITDKVTSYGQGGGMMGGFGGGQGGFGGHGGDGGFGGGHGGPGGGPGGQQPPGGFGGGPGSP